VLENRVLRRIFSPNREEVLGGWRRLEYTQIAFVEWCSVKAQGQVLPLHLIN
jgi:hypothetical protein